MATVGIIGGIGPESTIDYYRLLIAGYREHKKDDTYPHIIINSVNLQELRDLLTEKKLDRVADILVEEVNRLERAGAQFGFFAANSAHVVFEEVQQRVSIPLVSISEATCEEVKKKGMKKLALLGTRFTMEAPFYHNLFAKEGITLVLPNPKEIDYIHQKYIGELLNNIFLPETREGILGVVDRMAKDDGIEGIILGGTELPLIIGKDMTSHNDLPFFDTTQIHARAVVSRMLGGL